MKILITGNMGYVGPGVVYQLRRSYPEAILVGLDMGYFAHCLTHADRLPECRLDHQYFGDVRRVSKTFLSGMDAIVHLAAISNDPMGNVFEEITADINYRGSLHLAKEAKKSGVKTFVFASSCSVYGFAEEGARTESSAVNPLTAYARSKVAVESELKTLADKDFKVSCLRFSTACGMSERLRLDLVLNDFVAAAVASKEIKILSDGSPWRPLINVKDMARAIDWAIQRKTSEGGPYLLINIGEDGWNYQVRDLAKAVQKSIPGVRVSINKEAPPDKRSYKVSFKLFETLAPKEYRPQCDLLSTIQGLKNGLEGMRFQDPNFRSSSFMRLNVLTHLRETEALTDQLLWA